MLWHIYLRKGTVFVPTVAKTEAGFFVDVDPVAVIESSDHASIVDAIKATVIKGNPIIETPTRAAFPKPVILGYANVKSWATFEKSALCWIISKKENILQLRPQRKNPDRGWEDDPDKVQTFTGTSAVDEIAETAAKQINRGMP